MDGILAILGAGQMGEALLSGLLRSQALVPAAVRATVLEVDQAARLAQTYAVTASTDSPAAVRGADVIVLATKPQSLPDLLDAIAGNIEVGQTVVSVAAGVPTAAIEGRLPQGVAVVRVMTNVGVQVDEAMSVIAPGRHATRSHMDIAAMMFGKVGRVRELPEAQLDAVTALSGSGPAYLCLVAEALIEGGVLLGLAREVATELVVQTMVASATLLRDTGKSPTQLRESVTSPGGTTIAALQVLEQQGVRAALIDAVEAASNRARALAQPPAQPLARLEVDSAP